MNIKTLQQSIRQLANPALAEHSQRFFKTGPGEYGEGDLFLGIRIPALRQLIPRHVQTPLPEVVKLLHSPYHEERFFALLLLVAQFKKGDQQTKTTIYDTYIEKTAWINNWDLVDCSAPPIVGAHLDNRERTILQTLAVSESVWERRIAVLATFHFIRQGSFADSVTICRILLADRHDLIHKAVGWMLREIGKRNMAVEERFLRLYYRTMPRTMLRYAIERFPESRRMEYLLGKVPCETSAVHEDE